MKKNRTLVVSVLVLVVAGIAVYAVATGMYPPKSGTEGAIGAASRYQAQQIADADVSLQDASVQAFLQSDTFNKMATNATFRKHVLDSKSTVKLKNLYQKTQLADGADLAELLDGAEIAELMNDSELLNAVAGDELFKKALNQQEIMELAKNVVAAKKSKAQSEATAADLEKFAQALQQAGVSDLEKKSRLFKNNGFTELLARGHARALLGNRDLLELLSDDGLAEMFNDDGLQANLLDRKTIEVMKIAPAEMLSKALNAKSIKNP